MQNHGVKLPKLSGVLPVSGVKVSQLHNYTSYSKIAETLNRRQMPARVDPTPHDFNWLTTVLSVTFF